MSAPGRSRSASSARQRVLPALMLVAIAGACASVQSEPGHHLPVTTVMFENNSAEPVRVFLVERFGIAYSLGKVQPMQRRALPVPAHLAISSDRQVALVAVPSSRSRPTLDVEAEPFRSVSYSSVREITSQRWTMTSMFLFSSGVAPR